MKTKPINMKNFTKITMKKQSQLILAIGLSLGIAGCDQPHQTMKSEPLAAPLEQTPAEPKPIAAPPKPIVAPSESKEAPPESPGKPEQVLLDNLDPDGNGLYDDTERKALLDVFLKECPELQESLNTGAAPVLKAKSNYQEDFEVATASKAGSPAATAEQKSFDANGDGKVTIQEQTQGRHPLSMLVPKRIVESKTKIPWAIDIFPEWISSAYMQEDVAAGKVAGHSPRGTVQAKGSQDSPTLQPEKTEAGSGVVFAADSGEFLLLPGQRDAQWNYRWSIFTFRIDAATGTGERTVLLDLNQGNSSNKSSPKVWFDKKTGLSIQYVGQNKAGLDKRIMTTKDVIADGKTWNVAVFGIRYGQMFASVNGVPLSTETPQPARFSGDFPENSRSYLGDKGNMGNMAWAYDALVFGLTEPSEAMVRKMTGWAAHRLGMQANLPDGHPYKDQRPVLDAEDFPYRYVHDDEKWNEWGNGTKTKHAEIRANTGGPRQEPQGFERVFYDDFRANRVMASTSGEGDLWMGPGFNTAVGGDASLATPGKEPNTYPYDAKTQKQTLSLAQQKDGRWRGSAFYSVNNLGHGYTWKGPKVYRIRCMFPKVPQKDLTGGLFPAFWSYDPGSLTWVTGNRIEVDWFEFDGLNGAWLNGLATHFHYPYRKDNIFAKNPNSYNRFKALGGELTEKKTGIPGGIYFWDGQFHTWEFIVDEDMTYVNVTIPDGKGGEKWIELGRTATAPTYLERLDIQLDYALKGKEGKPKDGTREDFVVDWIEVMQKTDALATIPEPYTAKPSLSGSTSVGGTITCEPNLEVVTDIRYYWFADGYPLTYGPDSSYVMTSADAGKEIRCMVKAVGALDMPEAWSDGMK